MPRLTVCHVCSSITKLPDPPKSAPLVPARWAWDNDDGSRGEYIFRNPDTGMPVMVAAYDPALEDWVERHAHEGQFFPLSAQKHEVHHCDQATWDSVDVMQKLRKDLMGVTGRMYMERDQLKADAVECFIKHGRPEAGHGCPDWHDESKVIGSHESNKNVPKHKRMFLCDLCPFTHGVVAVDIRHKKGMYKDNWPQKVAERAKRRGRRR